MVSSISLGVTLAYDMFLFMLRYTTSNNTIYSFLIKVRIIPKLMSQIKEEFLLLLIGETGWYVFGYDIVCVISIPGCTM